MTAVSRSRTVPSTGTRRRLARVGLVARGALYCLVGVLALGVALGGANSQQASQTGALRTVAREPYGTAIVALVGVGLLAYAAWRFSQFFTEKNAEDSDVKNAVMRISYLVRTVIYVGLAYVAFTITFGSGGGGGGNSEQALTAMIMRDVPGGVVVVALVGVIIVGVGCYQAYKTFGDNDFMDELRQHEMSPTARRWTKRIGAAGHIARAIVYVIIGVFIVVAALQFDPQEARGLDGALQTLAQQPYGPWLLTAVAFGLLLFGVFTLIRARYVTLDG